MEASVAAVRVTGLGKRHGDAVAVARVDLSVEQGEVVASLGPDGAGKTTTVEILEGHRRRSGGAVQVLGFDPGTGGAAFWDRIGIVLHQPALDERLTVAEVLEVYRRLSTRRGPQEELLELVGLRRQRTSRVEALSAAERRRLELALGPVGDPDLLSLDEPTTGFDAGDPPGGGGDHRQPAHPGAYHPADHPVHRRGKACATWWP